MYKIKVHTDELDLIECLQYEGTHEGENEFSFSSIERASEVISRYVYYIVKNDILEKIVPQTETFTRDCEEFLLFVPSEYEDMWRKRVREDIHDYLETGQADELFVEGFITFRLQGLKGKYFSYMHEEYLHFLKLTEPSGNVESLIDYMHSQPVKTEEIVITTLPNGHIVMKDEYECLYIEQDDQQENIIVQSIFHSPKKVKVVDEHDILKKQFVIVLRQIFGNNVTFVRTIN